MLVKRENENDNCKCANVSGVADKLFYLLIGGGIGAAVALIFAPKSGEELRRDIADAALKGYDETLDAANQAKVKAVEYYEAAKEKGGELLDSVTEKATAFKSELKDDASKIMGTA